MSNVRTYTVTKPDGSQHNVFTSRAHDNQTMLERAMREGHVLNSEGEPVTPFQFDLIDTVKAIRTESMRNESLRTLAFFIDAYIQGALGSMLNDYYQHSKEQPAEDRFVDYQTFLDHIEGMEASEQTLYEAGLDVQPKVERVRNLLAFRAEVHAALAGQLRDPTTYVTPNLSETLAHPTLRKVSAKATLGYRELAAEDAEGDKELEEEIFQAYKQTAKVKKIQQFNMDDMKAKSLVTLLSCIKADVSDASTVDEEGDAFYDMDARTQFGLIRGLRNAITKLRVDAVEDNRMSVMEKATLRVESKPLIKLLDHQLAHDKFSELH